MKHIAVLITCAGACIAVPAQADGILVAAGRMRPEGCAVQLSNGGVVDYGVIPLSALPTGRNLLLAQRELIVEVTCMSAMAVTIATYDNRRGSALAGVERELFDSLRADGSYDAGFLFGLGEVDGKKVGGYAMLFKQGSFRGDGADVVTLRSRAEGRPWIRTPSGAGRPGERMAWGAPKVAGPGSYRDVRGAFLIAVALNQREQLPTAGAILIDGLATLELAYL